MNNYSSRAGKTLLIIVLVVSSINYVKNLAYNREINRKPIVKLIKVTAYCPCEICCGKWADGQTASGYWIQPGDRFVAAPKHIPFGTKMIIPGYNNDKPVEVKDRGGAITVSRLDVYFDDHQEALIWGVQYLEIKQ